MKIAIITDDERTVSQYFGRANYCAVLTIENGQIIQREMREKLSHQHFANEFRGHSSESDRRHGLDPASQSCHGQMFQAITASDILANHVEKLH